MGHLSPGSPRPQQPRGDTHSSQSHPARGVQRRPGGPGEGGPGEGGESEGWMRRRVALGEGLAGTGPRPPRCLQEWRHLLLRHDAHSTTTGRSPRGSQTRWLDPCHP